MRNLDHFVNDGIHNLLIRCWNETARIQDPGDFSEPVELELDHIVRTWR